MSGVNPIPSNPFHIARAYQVMPPRAMQPVAPVRQVAPNRDTATAGAIGAQRPEASSHAAKPVGRMVAGVVPGRISFAGSEPTSAGPALPMYRHPADKNAAATAISVGRSLDIKG
jgi:hypothetical protein